MRSNFPRLTIHNYVLFNILLDMRWILIYCYQQELPLRIWNLVVFRNRTLSELKLNNNNFNCFNLRSPLFGQEFPSLESAELEGKKGGQQQQQQQQLQQHNFQQPPPSQPQQEGGTGMLPFPRFLTLFDATKF